MCGHTKHNDELLTIDQVPRFLRYNYYIRSGYRQQQTLPDKSTFAHVLNAIFSWHNETVNIWTHLFGLIVFGGLCIYELFIYERIRIYVLMTCIACVIVFICSISYHATMNKCCTSHDYWKCLNYDVLGVLLSSTLSAMSPIINGYKCNYNLIIFIALILLFLSMIYSSLKVLNKDINARIRGQYVALHCLLRTALVLLFVAPNIYYKRYLSFSWHTISFLWLIVGGIINVSRYPEKLFVNKYVSSFFLIKDRAKFNKQINKKNDDEQYIPLLDVIRNSIDYIGNSHQIWHVFVLFSCFAVYYGCVWDDLYLNTTYCQYDEQMISTTSHNINMLSNNIKNWTNDKSSSVYIMAMELIFEPSFLYPF